MKIMSTDYLLNEEQSTSDIGSSNDTLEIINEGNLN